MKNVCRYLLCDTRFTSFHISACSFVLAGLFIASTASDLGPYAPLLVAFGIYAMLFALLLEAVFWLRVVLRKLLAKWVAL